MVIDRCHERHVILKMNKSWIGVRLPKLFGYEVSDGEYRLLKRRRESIAEIPLPIDKKGIQGFPGAAVYSRTPVHNYSDLTADLNNTVHKRTAEELWRGSRRQLCV